MANQDSNKNDKIVFANEPLDLPLKKNNTHKNFKLLIVDDEKEIHIMTKLVLSDYIYQGATLEFLSAYSGKEAKKLIHENPDAACILLDVVMETNDAGLEVARFIREDEKNEKLRIILRTGQPGKAPEKNVILAYDINDYKEKTELTTQKLFTSITTALRSYIHLVELDKKTQEIAEKNNRLNEEIARRIVAESNLTKYNRSLEKIITSKSSRLKKAIKELEKKESELKQAYKLTHVGEVSYATISKLDFSGDSVKENLEIMDRYRTDMTLLLDKYDTLENIIYSHSDSFNSLVKKTHEVLDNIDQLKKDIDLDEMLSNYPDVIKDSINGIEYISNAINDVRLFIAIADEPQIEIDINHMLEKVTNKIKAAFSSKIDLQICFGPVPKFIGAAKSLEKAFHEIIKNSFQAIKSQGIVSVSTCFENSKITIIISDIGQGIPLENLQKIFKPYFTTSKKPARGIGLTYAKSVLMNNNGTISINSIINEGTNIIVALAGQKETT